MTDEKEPDVTEIVCGATLLIGLPLWVFWSAYVDSLLWLWFAVPLGLPPIGIAHMAGLSVLIRSLTAQLKRKAPSAKQALSHAIFGPAFFLLFGWVIHRFFMVAQ